MKITESDGKITIYLNEKIIKKYHYSNDEKATKQILDIILKLNNMFNIDFKGLYKVNVFQNKKMGIILEIFKYDDLEIMDYMDFRIKIYDDYKFMLEFDEYFNIPDRYQIINYKDKFYIELDAVNEEDLIRLSDYYKIIYKDNKIIRNFGKNI